VGVFVIFLSSCVAELGVDGVKEAPQRELSNAPKNIGFR